MKNINKLFTRILVMGFLFLFGCTHALEMTNLSSYRSTQMNSLKNHKTVGLICTSVVFQ